jgi:hypothetical protein
MKTLGENLAQGDDHKAEEDDDGILAAGLGDGFEK